MSYSNLSPEVLIDCWAARGTSSRADSILLCAHMRRTLETLNGDDLMSNTKTNKQQQMHICSDSPSKQKRERATASCIHKSLPEADDEVTREYEPFTLSRADWDVFLNTLENPPKPNAKLRHAFTEHKRCVQRFRPDSPSKQKQERATASYVHKSLPEADDEEIREYEPFTLSRADWDVFLNTLENPPKPNAKLRHAFAEHKKRVRR